MDVPNGLLINFYGTALLGTPLETTNDCLADNRSKIYRDMPNKYFSDVDWSQLVM